MRKEFGAALVAASMLLASLPVAQAADPITIGFGMALTGGLAPNGRSALLSMQIWQDEVNSKGGLLGRPVKLVYYDDQSNPSTVPGLYTKLLDVDKVDLAISAAARSFSMIRVSSGLISYRHPMARPADWQRPPWQSPIVSPYAGSQ